MKNRVEVESAIMELKDLTVLTTMIRNNSETINNAEEYESLFSVVADALMSKVDKLYTAFYGANI
jgi:hypothetical protein